MADALCDVPGCGEAANFFGPSGRRCLPHANRPPFGPAPEPCSCEEAESLRAEVAALGDRITTICDEAIGLQPVQPAEDSLTMIEQHMAAMRREHAALQATHDATHALLDDALERIARTERVLECWPADGAFALRVLRGEVVR